MAKIKIKDIQPLRADSIPARLLVCRGGALGDFVLTLPAMAALKERWPRAEVQLLAARAHIELARSEALATGGRALDSAGIAPFFSAHAPAGAEWEAWLGGFDLIVSWMPDADGVWQRRALATGARRFVQAPWRCEGTAPAAEQLGNLPELSLRAATYFPFRGVTRHSGFANTIAVHPGSGSVRKNWPPERWFAVLRSLDGVAPKTDVLFITGEAEAPEVLAYPDKLRAAGMTCRHAHSLPAAELAEMLTGCRVLLGHDSGPAHLASACGVPCRLLFGPTNPAVWAPQGPDLKVLTAPGGDMFGLDLATVTAWVTDTWPASAASI